MDHSGVRGNRITAKRAIGTATMEDGWVDGPFNTLQRHAHADVTWTLAPGDQTGTTFVASGTATYSGSGTRFGCAIELAPTTIAITGELRRPLLRSRY